MQNIIFALFKVEKKMRDILSVCQYIFKKLMEKFTLQQCSEIHTDVGFVFRCFKEETCNLMLAKAQF